MILVPSIMIRSGTLDFANGSGNPASVKSIKLAELGLENGGVRPDIEIKSMKQTSSNILGPC